MDETETNPLMINKSRVAGTSIPNKEMDQMTRERYATKTKEPNLIPYQEPRTNTGSKEAVRGQLKPVLGNKLFNDVPEPSFKCTGTGAFTVTGGSLKCGV